MTTAIYPEWQTTIRQAQAAALEASRKQMEAQQLEADLEAKRRGKQLSIVLELLGIGQLTDVTPASDGTITLDRFQFSLDFYNLSESGLVKFGMSIVHLDLSDINDELAWMYLATNIFYDNDPKDIKSDWSEHQSKLATALDALTERYNRAIQSATLVSSDEADYDTDLYGFFDSLCQRIQANDTDHEDDILIAFARWFMVKHEEEQA